MAESAPLVEKKRSMGPCGVLLNQKESQEVDEFLFTAAPVEQLMELAGLSCAAAVPEVYPAAQYPRILVACGPGNNGGDGLVAARHLHFFGYQPIVLYPKQTDKQLYQNLKTQLDWLSIPVAKEMSELGIGNDWEGVDVIMDCFFGFSFKGGVRAPFDTILELMASGKRPPIISVDIPSGWDVELGPPKDGPVLSPEVLISLSAPKMCSEQFKGRHFLGGRFIPPIITKKYDLQLPPYPGVSQVVELPNTASSS